MVVLFGPPTTTLHCQPVFAASTDCVSIADRRIVCVMCTQLHSCWRTMDGWWFQWLRWLVVAFRGQDWELFALCGCVHARRRVILSACCLICVHFFLVCSPPLIIKAISAVKWGHGCVRVRVALPFLTGNFASSLVTGLTRNLTWFFDSLNMAWSLDWLWWWFPKTPFSDYVSLVFGLLPLVSIAAVLNVQGRSCGTDHVIRSRTIYLDFDGVTLWFCIVSICSSFPLASS